MALRNRKLLATGIIAAALATSTILGRAVQKVMAGQGAEIYQNYKGMQFTYSGLLVTFGVCACAVVAALGYAFIYRRRERKLNALIAARNRESDTAGPESR